LAGNNSCVHGAAPPLTVTEATVVPPSGQSAPRSRPGTVHRTQFRAPRSTHAKSGMHRSHLDAPGADANPLPKSAAQSEHALAPGAAAK
jgi:hypothetical protein